ncbi:MAG TPA: Fe-S-binding domain-containing protein, partial [Chloroflexota bacterium]|nr:Fe-S-binding domain-containing protein [Chloroflexota bacterium]
LPMVQRVAFNALDRPANRAIPDLNGRELAVLLPLVALILWIGLYPKPFLARMQPAAEAILAQVRNDRLAPVAPVPVVAADLPAREGGR